MPPARKITQPDGTEEKGDHCAWSVEDLWILARGLEEGRSKGAEGGFSGTTYTAIANELNIAPTAGVLKTATSVKSKTQAMKKQWKELKEIKDTSGWGWNEAEQKPEGSEDQWQQFLNTHKPAPGKPCPYKKYKHTGWIHYSAFDRAFNGSVATGANVVRPWDRSAREESFSLDQDDTEELGDESLSSNDSSAQGRGLASRRRAASPDSSSAESQPNATPFRSTQGSLTNAQRSQQRKLAKKAQGSELERIVGAIEGLVSFAQRTQDSQSTRRPETPRMERKRRVFEDIDKVDFMSEIAKIKLYDMMRKDYDMVETYLAVPGDAQREGLLLHWAGEGL